MWPALNKRYATRKKKYVGRKKILVLTGNTKARFTTPSSPYYIQEFIPGGVAGGVFRFGAMSDVAAAHYHGRPELATTRSGIAQLLFGGIAKVLPVRDMISKTAAQLSAFNAAIVTWYRTERVPQVLKAQGLISGENRSRSGDDLPLGLA